MPFEQGREFIQPEIDSIKLMRQLAEMAGVEARLFRRMVLVLDVNDAPRLYCESFLYSTDKRLTSEGQQIQAQIRGADDPPLVVNTTTLQNEKWETHQQIKRQ